MRREVAGLLAVGILALCGCDDTSQQSQQVTRNPDPLYEECVSLTPVDPGNPNEPVIRLNGARSVNQKLGMPYADAGASAMDPSEGDISSRIAITGLNAVDTNAVGDYLIRYNVDNSRQLRAVEAVRVVRVTDGSFARQTARDIGSTSAHMGYYEHLPIDYGNDPKRKFPLLVYQHGWYNARFLDPYTVQAPLSILATINLSGVINAGQWDDSRPFIVLSPQRCVDPLTYVVTATQIKTFIDYAINTYNVDTSRIYMAGHSQGSGDTWDYVTNYPQQLAAVVPISGGYGTQSGCVLKETPAWAFNGDADTVVPYQNQIDTVNSINACNPAERAKVTILPGADHLTAQYLILTLQGLGQGLPQYDVYDPGIYDWMLAHQRPVAVVETGGVAGASQRDSETAGMATDRFDVSPREILPGQRAAIRWSMRGADVTCNASGDWIGVRPRSGTEWITPATPGMYNYVLSCQDSRGSVAESITLTVKEPAIELLESYAGRYRVHPLGDIVISREGRELVAETGGMRLPLRAISATVFECTGRQVVLTFQGNGRPRCPKIAVAIHGLRALTAIRQE